MQLAGRLGQRIAASQLGKKILGKEGQDLLVQNIPGAITGGLFTLAGTGSIPAALTTAALDMGLSYGGARLAGKFAPGTQQTILRKNKAGAIEKSEGYEMSTPQKIASGVGNVAAMMAAPAFLPATQLAAEDPRLLQQLTTEPTVMDQTASLEQQLMQRAMLNRGATQSLSPGTQFQLNGLESTLTRGMQVPNELDPYGLNRA